jgi:tRNA 2-thiouridine synthesizing protein A
MPKPNTASGDQSAEIRALMSAHPDAMILDTRHLLCPLPVLRLAKAARESCAGQAFVVLATDPVAARDIPALCQDRCWTCEILATGLSVQAYRIATARA